MFFGLTLLTPAGAVLPIASMRSPVNPLHEIRQIDYTVIFARNMEAMRRFYETVMEFPLERTLSDKWIEYRVGSNTLALAARGGLFDDAPPPKGALSVQLAFRVPPSLVAKCAATLYPAITRQLRLLD